MDDEDAKVRRNLVAFCTLLILAWWLHAPVGDISNKLLGFDLAEPGIAWRAWAAAAVALCYFTLRFRFSKEHKDAVSEMKREFFETRSRIMLSWLRFEASLYLHWRFTPPVFGDGFHVVVGESVPGRPPITRLHVGNFLVGRQNGMGQVVGPQKGELFGEVSLDVTRENPNFVDHTALQHIGFEFNRTHQLLLHAATVVRLMAYSKASTVLLAPWLLVVAALAICCLRLYRTW